MRKIFAGLVLFGLTISYAHAVSAFACSKCDQDLMQVGSTPDGESYDTCEAMCQAIKNTFVNVGTTGDPNEYGVFVYQTWTYEETCGAWVGGMGRLGSCHAVPEDNYKCGKGYYGTATSETSGCTKCPANATCTNGIIFNCNSGWYKNTSGNGCSQCPSPDTGTGDEKNWTVASSSSVGNTGGIALDRTGATDIGQCYLTNTSVVTDNTGTYEIEGATGGGGLSGPGKYCDYYGKY